MEKAPFLKKIIVKTGIIVVHNLMDDGKLRTACLQDDKSLLALPSRTPRHLAHHHERMLISPEVGIIEHCIGIEDPDNRHIVEVEPFGYHLRTDEHIGLALAELTDKALVGTARTRGVKVHSRYPCLRKLRTYEVFYLLRAIAPVGKMRIATIGTTFRHRHREATVMAGE